MSEWVSVIAVFWILWALDGARILPRAIFTITGGGWRRAGGVAHSRLSRSGWWPWSWRLTVADVPLTLSPAGICNRPAGAAGRPAEIPTRVQAWRWEEIREIGVAKGWIFVNGARFCADTGHVTAPDLLALARGAPVAREQRLRVLMSRWFRPEHLRRRARVLAGRTRVIAELNTTLLGGCVLLALFAAGVITAQLSDHAVGRVATVLPWVLLGLVAVHFGAVVVAWRAVARLKAVAADKRRTNLFSALLMPPQAMRLRALVGEGFFPPQHPLAAIVAFAGRRAQATAAFHVVADLRWPIGADEDSPLAREIAKWFQTETETRIGALLTKAKLATDVLLAAPTADTPTSCSYCPRCGDQFVAGRVRCPQGVALRPLRRP